MARQPARRPEPEVQSITAARRAHGDDMHERMVKYAISMAVRTVCFVMAFVVTGWLQWVFIAGAVLLPYVAVLIANAGREQSPQDPGTFVGPQQAPALTAEPAPVPRRPEAETVAAQPVRVDGEVVPGRAVVRLPAPGHLR